MRGYTCASGNASRLMSVSNLPLTVDASEGYDTWGNMRKYTLGGVAYELNFNAENRLASVKVGAAQPTVFAYDADGQRVQTTYPDGTIVYTPFPDYEVEDPPGTGANTVRTTYRLARQIVAVQTKVGTAAGTFYYTYTDHLGNITALSWTGGTFVPGSKARFDPFGAMTTTPTTNPSISNHGFTGHRHNNTGTNDLGLIYMNARYYLPEVGRFISPDTIVPEPGNPQSFNRYAYTNNNPMGYTDSTGHWLESALDLAFIAYDIYDIQQNGLNRTNGLSLAVDIGGLALPVVTGGGLMVRAVSHGDDVAKAAAHVDDFGPVKAAIEALKAGDAAPMEALQGWQKPIVRGFISEAKMLDKLGFAKNTRSISAIVDGNIVTTIPDYLDDGAKVIGEIKDVAELQGTSQIKAQLAWAREHSYQYRIHVQPGTKIPQWLFKFWEDNRSWFKIMGDVTGLE